jgi:hypothetical protein
VNIRGKGRQGVSDQRKKKLNLIAGDVAIKFLKLMIRVRCCRMEKVLLAMKSSDSLIDVRTSA